MGDQSLLNLKSATSHVHLHASSGLILRGVPWCTQRQTNLNAAPQFKYRIVSSNSKSAECKHVLKPMCGETTVGIVQRHRVDTTAARRRCVNCSAYPPRTNNPKLRSGCRRRHDPMNIVHERVPPNHAHQPFRLLCMSAHCAWKLRSNSKRVHSQTVCSS